MNAHLLFLCGELFHHSKRGIEDYTVCFHTQKSYQIISSPHPRQLKHLLNYKSRKLATDCRCPAAIFLSKVTTYQRWRTMRKYQHRPTASSSCRNVYLRIERTSHQQPICFYSCYFKLQRAYMSSKTGNHMGVWAVLSKLDFCFLQAMYF